MDCLKCSNFEQEILDWEIVKRKLVLTFDTEDSGIEYYGRTRPRNNHTYAIKANKIDSIIQDSWSRSFPEASSYSINKGTDGRNLIIIAEISNDDFKKVVERLK